MSEISAKVAVLGGAGYIGQVAVKRLLTKGFCVHVVDSFIHGEQDLSYLKKYPNFTFEKGDLNDPLLRERISGYENIVLLAALVGEPACDKNPELTFQSNYLSPLSLLDSCLYRGKTERFVFISTDSCYGNRPNEILTEESGLKPLSLYAELKAKLEEKLLVRVQGSSLSTIILRLATVYGLSPRMRFDLVVNLLTREAVIKNKATIYSGEQWRPLVHVRDVAQAIELALVSPLSIVQGEVFNVGQDSLNIKFVELGKLISECVPDCAIEIVPGAPDLRDYYVSFKKIKQLNFSPEISLKEGILEIKEALSTKVIKDPYLPIYRNA
jgi:nucleoside-diphosphate-sugar epimerase